MNRISKLVFFLLFVIPAFTWAQQDPIAANDAEAALEIEMELCESIVAKRPLNPKTTFDPGDKAHCWVNVKNNYPGDYFLVEWVQNDTLRHTQHLYLPQKDMHTYVAQRLQEPGKWRAEIKDRKGNLLTKMDFVVRKEELEFFGNF